MEAFEFFLNQQGYHPGTAKRYRTDTQQFIRWAATQQINAEQATYNDLSAYVQWMLDTKKLERRTMVQRITALKHFYHFLSTENKVRSDNPASALKLRTGMRKLPPKPLSREQLEQLYRDFEVFTMAHRRNKAMLGLLLWQGVAASELGRIETTDIDLNAATIYIGATHSTNSRTLPLNAAQMLDMQQYIDRIRPVLMADTGKTGNQLFVSMGAGNKLKNALSILLPKLRLLQPQLIDLNHIRISNITHWVKAYGLRKAQYMAGHKYISSTERYRSADLEDLQSQLDRFHPLG